MSTLGNVSWPAQGKTSTLRPQDSYQPASVSNGEECLLQKPFCLRQWSNCSVRSYFHFCTGVKGINSSSLTCLQSRMDHRHTTGSIRSSSKGNDNVNLPTKGGFSLKLSALPRLSSPPCLPAQILLMTLIFSPDEAFPDTPTWINRLNFIQHLKDSEKHGGVYPVTYSSPGIAVMVISQLGVSFAHFGTP